MSWFTGLHVINVLHGVRFRVQMTALGDRALCSLLEVDVSEMGTASIIIALIMKVVCTYATSVYFSETTCQHMPEGCHFRSIGCSKSFCK
jgi:hypothetical protein